MSLSSNSVVALAAAAALLSASGAGAQLVARTAPDPKIAQLEAEVAELKGTFKLMGAAITDLQKKTNIASSTAGEAIVQNVNQEKYIKQVSTDLTALRTEYEAHNHVYSAYLPGSTKIEYGGTSGPSEFCKPSYDKYKQPDCPPVNIVHKN